MIAAPTLVDRLPRTLPTTDEEQIGLLEQLSLSWTSPDGTQRYFAPISVITSLAETARRTGLDPFAGQLYAKQYDSVWRVLSTIDGFRAVAQATGEYQGATPIEYSRDGRSWTTTWMRDEPPAAARMGVRRVGFVEPQVHTVLWSEFGNAESKRPVHDFGIRAESHALRRAFTQLAGIYTAEDFAAGAEVPPVPAEPSEDWAAAIAAATAREQLVAIKTRIVDAGEMTPALRTAVLARAGVLDREATAQSAQITDNQEGPHTS